MRYMRKQMTKDAARNTKYAWVAKCKQMLCRNDADSRVFKNSAHQQMMSDGFHVAEVSLPEWLRGWT